MPSLPTATISRAISHSVQKETMESVGEIGVIQAMPRLIQNLAQWQLYELQMRDMRSRSAAGKAASRWFRMGDILGMDAALTWRSDNASLAKARARLSVDNPEACNVQHCLLEMN